MRYKRPALASFLALSVTAVGLWGVPTATAGIASTGVLCKSAPATHVCPPADVYRAGTSLKATLKSAKFSNGFITVNQCISGELNVSVIYAGGADGAVQGANTTNTMTGCASTITFVSPGDTDVYWEEGTDSGAAYVFGSRFTTNSGLCEYGFGGPEYPMQLVGGTTGRFIYNAPVTTLTKGCQALTLTAEYEITSPAPLYVEQTYEEPTGQSTVLCKAAEVPCSVANRYSAGTKVQMALKSGKNFRIRDLGEFITINLCESSTMEGEVLGAGGVGTLVTAATSTATYGKCSKEGSAQGLPWFTEIERTEGTNGKLTLNNFAFKTKFAGNDCVFVGDPTYTVTGGAPAEISIKGAILELQSGPECPEKAKLDATYVVSSPSPLYISTP